MTESRRPAVVRGFASATLAIFIALAGHVSGGGLMPGMLGIAVPWLLSLMVCVLLAGRTLSLFRLSLSVGISQFLFHLLFVLGTVTPSGSPAAHHMHGGPLVLPAVVGVDDAVVADGSMWIGHLAAALTTIAALHWGERLVHALRALAAQAVRWLRRRLCADVVLARPRARVDCTETSSSPRTRPPLFSRPCVVARPPSASRSDPTRIRLRGAWCVAARARECAGV